MEIKYNDLTMKLFQGDENSPLVLMHENEEEGGSVWNILKESGLSCTLACISGMKWEHDLAPWKAPATFKKADPFTGGADDHLNVIINQLIPLLEEKVGFSFSQKYIAGYSLAGLFAMYSVYQTDTFAGFVSASGSMWFPDFVKYVEEHKISSQVKRAYFSIGDKEAKTRNQVMQPVEDNTRKLEKLLSNQGIVTTFELNAGGHFVDDDIRLAKGIKWLLSH